MINIFHHYQFLELYQILLLRLLTLLIRQLSFIQYFYKKYHLLRLVCLLDDNLLRIKMIFYFIVADFVNIDNDYFILLFIFE